MIQDAVTARLLPKQPLVTRLDAVIEAAAVCLDAPDGVEKVTARLHTRGQPTLRTSPGSKQIKDKMAPPSRTQQCQKSSRVAPLHSTMMAARNSPFAPPRKSRLSAPQPQAQLSRLSDRTRLRRPKKTLFSKGAWQQVTRIGGLCRTHVSHN